MTDGKIVTLPVIRIERETDVDQLTAPISMQDVRLVAGEGRIAAPHMLQAVNVILRKRRDKFRYRD